LIGNALDFRAPNSVIRVEVRAGIGSAELSVGNTGPKLPAEMLDRLFDSMVSVRPQTGGNDAHLGLGLYIVRLIAEFHHGAARLQNRADGSGVDAIVTLSTMEPIVR
jgi:two-component system, OmpR family, sensor histidine kinase ChvG